MGAALSRIRSASTAGKAIAIGALLFVGGTAGILYQQNPGITATAFGASYAPAGVETIPLPRKLLPGRIAPASAPGDGSSRRQRPRRSQPMPRGVVQHTTDLEMEASLAGNPERRKQLEGTTPPVKKSLLAVPVGIKNKEMVNSLVSKFPADRFTVMLFHYDGALEQWSDLDWSPRALHIAAHGQTKWWFAKRFLHPDVVAQYEYVFLWDEDIEVENFDPLRYLDIVRREGLDVSQPALDRRSEMHHAITARALMPTSDLHRRAQVVHCDNDSMGPPCMGWVEVMVPVFSQEAWRCVWHMVQNDLIHGWGLDYKLGYCAQGDRTQSVGVIDSEYVLHRGIPVLSAGAKNDGSKGASSTGRGAVRLRSFKEMEIFKKRWKDAAAEDKSWTDPFAAESSSASSR